MATFKKLSISGSGGGGAEVVTKYAYVGTTVPNTGTITNVYWNTNLSNEEINTLIQNANLTWGDLYGVPIYGAYITAVEGAPTALVGIGDYTALIGETAYVGMDMASNVVLFCTSATLSAELGFVGWNPELVAINGVVAVSGELQSSFADMGLSSVGAENDKLISLISASEYTKEVVETMSLSGIYEGTALSFTANGENDVKSLIEADKKIPLSISIIVPNLLKERLEGTISEDGIKYMNGVSHLDEYAFAGCTGLTDIVIPDTQGELGKGVFLNCTGLKNVTIPEGVTEIDAGCFAHCWNLDDVKIPATVTRIGGTSTMLQLGAFESSHVKRISFAEGSQLQEIGDRAFNWCVYLEEIELPENLIKIGSGAIVNCEIRSLVFPKSIQNIDVNSVVSCDRLTSVLIPDTSNLTISRNAIYSKALTIYCEAKSRPGSWAADWTIAPVVWDCNNNDVADDGYIYVLSNGIRYGIKDGVASVMAQPSPANDDNPTVELPDNITYKNNSYVVTTIGSNAFENCFNVESIAFPSNLVSIGMWAFNNGSVRTMVTLFDFRNAIQVPILNVSSFGNLKDTCKIVVPDALYDQWIAAENWSTYADHIVKASEYTES